jgi:hypothetical protein
VLARFLLALNNYVAEKHDMHYEVRVNKDEETA